MKGKIVAYSGSFDPITNGHLDIISRSRKIFDRVVVLITKNEQKKSFFTLLEREKIIKEVLKDFDNVEVDVVEDGLLVDYLKKRQIYTIIRGIRNGNDLEYEKTNAYYNKKFFPQVETLFMPCSLEYTYVSSSAVREVVQIGGDLSSLVPPCVEMFIKNKIKSESK